MSVPSDYHERYRDIILHVSKALRSHFCDILRAFLYILGGIHMIQILKENHRKLVLDYLERNHLECTFLIGNVKQFGINNNRNFRRCADYYGYFEGNDLKGILPLYNLGSCIPHFESENAVPEFAKILKNRSFTFLLGMKKFIKPLYDSISPYKTTLNYSEDSYFVNNNFKPFVLPEVKIKDASELKLDFILDFMLEARLKGFGERSTKADRLDALKQRGPEEDFLFEINDGIIVATACIQTCTSRINQVGGVYTTEAERGKGYCKAIVSELCRRITARGKTPTLMVRNNNTPAVKAYTSLGFDFYDDYLIVTFKQ